MSDSFDDQNIYKQWRLSMLNETDIPRYNILMDVCRKTMLMNVFIVVSD